MASEAAPSRPVHGVDTATITGTILQAMASVTAAGLGTLALNRDLLVTGAVLLASAFALAIHLGRRRLAAPVRTPDQGPYGGCMLPDTHGTGRIRVRLTPDGALVCETDAARALFGVSEKLRPAPEALASALRAASVAGSCPVVTVALNGIERHLGVLRDDQSDPPAAQLVDLTGTLIAERASATQAFVTLSSHELMNGITPLVSLSQTARDQIAAGEPGEALSTLDTVGSAARRMLVLLEALRAMARLPRPNPHPLRLGLLLDEAMALARARWPDVGLQLQLDPAVGASLVRLDRDLILQGLANLINNGAEAALSQTQPAPLPAAVTVGAQINAGHLSVSVTDTGPGIASEISEEVFRPFFTTRERGSGIGLPLTAQIASVHGGWLQLLQTPPTTFVMTLPDCVLTGNGRRARPWPDQPA